MKVEILETILVCLIVSIQLYVFAGTYLKIVSFRNIIPKLKFFKISKILVPDRDLETLNPNDILANVQKYIKEFSLSVNNGPVENLTNSNIDVPGVITAPIEKVVLKTEVTIIECSTEKNSILKTILFSINNYLIRNRGAASDFNLIKDIVERNTDAVEEDINLSIGVPLYLGLMGTMIGIVIGLFNMPDLSSVLETKAKDGMLNDSIALLIGGVKIAMIASFTGLLLTIINSGWIFKGSRSLSEARKNEFYTLVQIELLPIINQGLASTLESLQRNLSKFNNEFTINLKKLTGIFDENARAINAQKELIDTIDKTKVSEITRYNVKVLQQLDVSVSQFEKFNQYLSNVNLFVDNSQQLVTKTNEVLARTDNFQTIANNIEGKLTQSQILFEFLSNHLKDLEQNKLLTSTAVADVSSSISNTFRELKTHIQNSSELLKNFTVEELELLKVALSESKTNLSNLEHLAVLKSDVSQFKMSSASQGERLTNAIEEMNTSMAKSIVLLEKIQHSSLSYKTKGFFTSIKNRFTKKK